MHSCHRRCQPEARSERHQHQRPMWSPEGPPERLRGEIVETEAIVGIAELVRLTLGHFDEPRSVALEVRFQAGYWLDRLYERRQESSEQGQKNEEEDKKR